MALFSSEDQLRFHLRIGHPRRPGGNDLFLEIRPTFATRRSDTNPSDIVIITSKILRKWATIICDPHKVGHGTKRVENHRASETKNLTTFCVVFIAYLWLRAGGSVEITSNRNGRKVKVCFTNLLLKIFFLLCFKNFVIYSTLNLKK